MNGRITPGEGTRRPCILCGRSHTSWRRLAVISHPDWTRPFDLYRCDCGLVFTSLAVDDSDLASLYNQTYFEQERFTPNAYAAIAKDDQAFLASLGPTGQGKTLLDAGCGEGQFLEVAKRLGYQPMGMDYSPVAVEKGRAAGHQVYLADIEGGQLPELAVDVTTSFETLEHVKDPVGYLGQLRSLTKPGGHILIKTIHLGNVFQQTMLALHRWTGGRVDILRLLFVPHHTYYFDNATLEAIVTKAGLELVRLERTQVPLDAITGNLLLRLILRTCYAWDAILGQGYLAHLTLRVPTGR